MFLPLRIMVSTFLLVLILIIIPATATGFRIIQTDATTKNTTQRKQRETDYAAEFTLLVLAALDLIVRLIVLGLVAAAIIWWIFWVFRVFPEFLADVGRRSEEAYGKIGLFIFVLIMAPSLLVFLIKTLLRVVQLLMQAILEFLTKPLFIAVWMLILHIL